MAIISKIRGRNCCSCSNITKFISSEAVPMVKTDFILMDFYIEVSLVFS